MLAYYWHNKVEVDDYLRRVRKLEDQQREEQEHNPSPAMLRLEQLIMERRAEYRTDP